MFRMLAHPSIDAALADLLRRELDAVAAVIERQLASDLPAVNRLCRHVERYRGKMLRPSLVLLTGLAARGGETNAERLTDAHRRVAGVVELIHLATLVHDDVLDEAEIRRRAETVNVLHGNETAVMLGDYLISNAFALCSSVGDPEINLALGRVTNTLCEGELLQLSLRGRYGIDAETYYEIVRRKTASLIGEACRLGARLSNAGEEVCDALHGYGCDVGLAFQIQDDLLDLLGEAATVGKSVGRDLEKGKITLPLILELLAADRLERGEILRLIRDRDHDGLRPRLARHGSIDAARDEARRLVARAAERLRVLPPGPVRDLLAMLAAAAVERSA